MAFVSNVVSGVACLGVLIGVLSGIFFLVFSGLRWARWVISVIWVRGVLLEKELQKQKRFLVGNSYSIDSHLPNLTQDTIKEDAYEETKEKNLESTPDPKSDWKDDQRDGNKTEKQSVINTDTIQVREFIEKLVETIIGGPLDGTTVGKLSTHSAYLGMFTKYHSLLCRELARLGFALHLSVVHENALEFDKSNSTHSNLKRLIKRIVSEAMALPNIKDILCRPKVAEAEVNDDFNNKSYEDILATAILNKVIENFQKRAEAKLNSEESDKPQKRSKKLTSKTDEDDDLVYNSDWSDTSRSEQLSLTIEEHIEEVTTTYEVSDDEGCEPSDVEEETINHRVPFPESGRVVRDAGIDGDNSDLEEQSSATELVTSTNSWEENWLFQRKRLRSTPNAHHPVPVPMLVPNPSEDYRALVGGVDADDLSDMSDCSDSVLEEMIVREDDDVRNPSLELEKYKHLITEDEVEDKDSPKEDNPKQFLVTETTVESSSEDSNTSKPKENDSSQEVAPETNGNGVCDVEDDSQENEYNSAEVVDDTKTTSQGPTSPENVPQKDREFSVEDIEWSQQYNSNNKTAEKENSEDSEQVTDEKEEEEFSSKIRCRIAEREKEKWENPVPLAVNPYSPDNILKREERNRNTYFRIGTYTQDYIEFPDESIPSENVRKKIETLRFARDYYVNSSKHPSGMSPASSLNQLLEGNEQDCVLEKNSKPLQESYKEYSSRSNLDNEENTELTKIRPVIKSQITLPNVKELAKQFASNNVSESNKPNGKTLSNGIPRTKLETNGGVSKQTEETNGGPATAYTRKQVHSLTARSISKEFREGLKNNSYQKVFTKTDRVGSGGESDQGDVVTSRGNTSPTPSVDLKNMKKFWEGIITANSIQQK